MSFIILGIGGGDQPVPMTTGENSDFALFKTRKKATAAAEDHPFFSRRGYKVVEWPYCKPNQPEKQ